jgi:hypothetical protein
LEEQDGFRLASFSASIWSYAVALRAGLARKSDACQCPSFPGFKLSRRVDLLRPVGAHCFGCKRRRSRSARSAAAAACPGAAAAPTTTAAPAAAPGAFSINA